MKRIVALFILTALCAPADSIFAQTTPAETPRFIPLVEPDSIMASCVPFPGDSISLVTEGVKDLYATVRGLEWDTVKRRYIIEVQGGDSLFRLIKAVNACSSKKDSFYLWLRVEEGEITDKPALVFPTFPSLKLQNYFFKEV